MTTISKKLTNEERKAFVAMWKQDIETKEIMKKFGFDSYAQMLQTYKEVAVMMKGQKVFVILPEDLVIRLEQAKARSGISKTRMIQDGLRLYFGVGKNEA